MPGQCETCFFSAFSTGSFDRCKLAEQLKEKPEGLSGEYYFAVKPFFYFQVHRKASCTAYREKEKELVPAGWPLKSLKKSL